ncbi:Protein N-acetyltransferase, RimJ/RimL family [Micromonospora echinaurantiaca]|uniref:Protein N-acetyltransferase, RimJ/RimL family n=1 Tax=Micromonospora echinaurantiaca TaxID=47857 RepID=A0A1C5JFK7_9ACTN|nr:GNAT family N-acetyltransferase [Micromonospora echinaurantiaca]SCG69345.1 Protein N-acetyltransferase, RimJ/RimL family [Micromonospora echinaurantiaca]
MTVLTTDRLVLRDWTADPADLARIWDIYSRVEITRWLAASGLPLTDPAQAADRLRIWRERHADHGGRYGTWAIEVRDTGRVAGTLILKPLPGADGVTPTDDIEVGWHLHPDSWGHGYATEAARAVLAREFAAGTRQVYAVVAPGNDPSMAVCRRLGMTHLGQRTDWYAGEVLETFVLAAPATSSPADSGRR